MNVDLNVDRPVCFFLFSSFFFFGFGQVMNGGCGEIRNKRFPLKISMIVKMILIFCNRNHQTKFAKKKKEKKMSSPGSEDGEWVAIKKKKKKRRKEPQKRKKKNNPKRNDPIATDE